VVALVALEITGFRELPPGPGELDCKVRLPARLFIMQAAVGQQVTPVRHRAALVD
jgi:hypothetical protein